MQAFIAAIKAVPMLINLVNRFIDMWIQSQIDEATDNFNLAEKKLVYLRRTIREAKTDDERIALSVILRDYHGGKMR